jgi:hypothetical protein
MQKSAPSPNDLETLQSVHPRPGDERIIENLAE